MAFQVALPGAYENQTQNTIQYAIPGVGFINETPTPTQAGGGQTVIKNTQMFLVF